MKYSKWRTISEEIIKKGADYGKNVQLKQFYELFSKATNPS